MRRDAIYPSIVVGKPPAEDEWLAKATERIFLPAIRTSALDGMYGISPLSIDSVSFAWSPV